LNWVFYINTNNSGCQWSPRIVGSPIAWQPEPLQKNFGKKLILSFFLLFFTTYFQSISSSPSQPLNFKVLGSNWSLIP
jgi:hypothetical protein